MTNEIRVVQTRTPSEKEKGKTLVSFYVVLPSKRYIAMRCSFKEDFGRLCDMLPVVTKEQLQNHEI